MTGMYAQQEALEAQLADPMKATLHHRTTQCTLVFAFLSDRIC